MTHNVRGLALCWHLKNIRPEPLVNKYKKVKVNNQKFNSITSARAGVDSDLKADFTNLQPA
jgi:hypothetical protein